MLIIKAVQAQTRKQKNDFKNYTMGIQEKYFNQIKSGEKVFEVRINTNSKKLINVGDTITFLKEPERAEELKTIVLDKLIFDNFDQMANTLNKKDLGFEEMLKEDMLKVYREIYNKEQESQGVLVFKVKAIN